VGPHSRPYVARINRKLGNTELLPLCHAGTGGSLDSAGEAPGPLGARKSSQPVGYLGASVTAVFRPRSRLPEPAIRSVGYCGGTMGCMRRARCQVPWHSDTGVVRWRRFS
jgi:hypothetical protein